MHKYTIFALKASRKIYTKLFGGVNYRATDSEKNPDIAGKQIYDLLIKDEPCMIARFGSTELTCLYNYLGVLKKNKNYLEFIKGKTPPLWWEPEILSQMQNWSGFFPPTKGKIEQFCELMLQEIPQVDILGSWLTLERQFESYLSAPKVHLQLLEPFWSKIPWTKALEGKKVLVVHPFGDTIASQYTHRTLLFKNQDVLPRFQSLQVIQAVQSLGEGDTRFKDWFEALDFMKNKIDACDYDVCLVGAGAYGFPLAAHVKRSGKKAVHLGGSLQLLFGIKGKRWEDPNYGVKEWGIPYGSYTNLINEYWVRPSDQLKPKNAEQVEGACYW
jgi:hypothetical protein